MIRRLTLTAALSLCLALSGTVAAQRGGAQGSTHSSAGAKSGGSSKPVHVKAYTKKDGTHVKEYDRSAPGREASDATSSTTSTSSASDDEYIGLLGLTQTQIQLQFGSPSSTSGD